MNVKRLGNKFYVRDFITRNLNSKLLICLQADRQMFVLHLVHGVFPDMFAKQVNVYWFIVLFFSVMFNQSCKFTRFALLGKIETRRGKSAKKV